VTTRFVFFRLFANSHHKHSNTLVAWGSWAGIAAASWALAFIIAEVIPFFSDMLSLMSSLFDGWFGCVLRGACVGVSHANAAQVYLLGHGVLDPLPGRDKVGRSAPKCGDGVQLRDHPIRVLYSCRGHLRASPSTCSLRAVANALAQTSVQSIITDYTGQKPFTCASNAI
jgi:hypothetical protein